LRAQQFSNTSLGSVQREFRVVLDIVDAINHTRTARAWLTQAALAEAKGDASTSDINVQTAAAKMELSKASAARYLALPKTNAEQRLAQDFGNTYTRYVDEGVTPLIDALRRHDLPAYYAVLAARTPVLDRGFGKALQYREQQSRTLNERIKRSFLVDPVVLAGLAVAYLVVVLWRFSRRTLSLPLEEMATALGNFADKRFAPSLPPLPTYAPSEVATMRNSLTVMQAEMSRTVGSIRDNAESLRIAAMEISQGTHDLAQRTESQAHQLQASTAALHGMTARIRTTSDASDAALNASLDAARAANDGGQNVARVVLTMESIQDASQRIGIIVSTIDSLAFQTNILALNAAVEAAKEIGQLIEDTLSRVASGSRHAAQAGEISRTLVDKVHSAARSMEGVRNSIVA